MEFRVDPLLDKGSEIGGALTDGGPRVQPESPGIGGAGSMPGDGERGPDLDERSRVDSILKRLNVMLEPSQIGLRYTVHEATKKVMVVVFNKDSGEVLREIPPSKVLDTMAKIIEFVGLVLDEKM